MQLVRLQKPGIRRLESTDGIIIFESTGDWTVDAIEDAAGILERLSREGQGVSIRWNVSGIRRIDSAGMMLFVRCLDLLKSNACSVEIVGAGLEHDRMYRLVRSYMPECEGRREAVFSERLVNLLDGVGKNTVEFFRNLVDFITFIGENFVNLLIGLRHPGTICFGAIIKNIEEAGVRAMPIVALTSFLIGVVIAYQGAVQLEKFGANIFIVDMIALSVTRELAPLITAIVVAGRSGSSYTAQIGVMKITEEIDAMRYHGV